MLTQFFNPESLAVIGASTNPEKLGFKVLKNIIDGGFEGKIFPVNPKGGEILNLKCYKNISEISEKVDLGIIIIPSKSVCEVAKECGEKGVKGLIVISAGFKETGEEGKKREEELKEIVKKYRMRLIGPNCLGVIDPVNKLNASFAFEMPPKGKISFITQSGALGTAILDWACRENVGLSKFVSFGNKADVSEIDLIEEFGKDPNTNVILLYLEGIDNGKEFINVAKKISQKKPIIIVKSGRTEQGGKAVSSHTGSIAGSDSAYDAAFIQSGVIRANSVEELFDYALIFSYQPLLKGDRIAIVTNAGGPAVMAIDAIEREGLELATLEEKTEKFLKELLPPAANIHNPVDALGDVLADTYGKVLDTVLSDENVDGVIAILTPQVITQIQETAEKVVEISRKHNKTVVGCFMGGKRIAKGINILQNNSIPNYPFPERAVFSLKGMSLYRKYLEKDKGEIPEFEVEKEKVSELIKKFKEEGRRNIGDIEGREIVSLYGIKVINSFLARNKEECVEYFKRIGKNVVMKLVSPDILHKTEAGGVKMNIGTPEEAEKAFEEIVKSAKEYKKDAEIIGVQIQPILKGVEVIVGVTQDPQFGHLLMFGLGGIYVELLKDVSFRVIPITTTDAEEMIEEIKTSQILSGFRNIPERDKEGIKDVLLRISKLCTDFPEIKEMDINPLIVMEKGKGAIAVDVRISFKF